MKTILINTLALFIVSCNFNPSVRLADGTIATGGGSLLTKSEYEYGRIVMADGTAIEFARQGKDETEVAKTKIRWEAAAGVIGASGAALNSTTKTITDAFAQ